ncbi:hypothetical protein QR680_006747 [Steinernema hermaphroditum]|uniref:Uncharacterized protein n=1 Tax=Steinernema hermaphroditum TaxID=289476 RepID=A0AA39LXX3_9BILA|nr:hypothetical protein QR680_006747 [Steinernema hermaphroditum]
MNKNRLGGLVSLPPPPPPRSPKERRRLPNRPRSHETTPRPVGPADYGEPSTWQLRRKDNLQGTEYQTTLADRLQNAWDGSGLSGNKDRLGLREEERRNFVRQQKWLEERLEDANRRLQNGHEQLVQILQERLLT